MTPPLLEVAHVSKRYAQHTALDDVSLSVGQGKIFGLLGPNGAGKSTLLRIINRIAIADAGEVRLAGRLMQADDVARIGYLPEERGLYRKMRVGEQLIYLARLRGLSNGQAHEALAYWLDRLDIAHWANKPLEELSKGMQQKVQFVSTVMHRPPLLIFDEPFSGFDPVNAEVLKREVLRLKAEGHTIIYSTHNMASVEDICDDIVLINQGRVVLEGSVHEVRRRFADGTYTATLEAQYALVDAPEFAITATTPSADGSQVHYALRATAGTDGRTLMQAVLAQAPVVSLAEQWPTMHDIFLNAVTPTPHG